MKNTPKVPMKVLLAAVSASNKRLPKQPKPNAASILTMRALYACKELGRTNDA